jgi:deazaflavin-dependent oxidoreductase (nitroreductase family)
MPSKLTLTAMNAVHRGLIAVSFGRLGWRFGSTPVLELTTTGRRSGQPRSTMLTSPLQLGDALVVVASRGGDDHHPAWLLNIEANPEVQVALEGHAPVPMHARVMSDVERSLHWPTITTTHQNYAAYQRRTDRVIPLVVLEPVAQAPGV